MVHLYWCLQVHIIECSQVLKAKYGTPFSAPLHILRKIHRLLIFLCSVNLFWHVKVIQEALLLYRKDGVSINTNHHAETYASNKPVFPPEEPVHFGPLLVPLLCLFDEVHVHLAKPLLNFCFVYFNLRHSWSLSQWASEFDSGGVGGGDEPDAGGGGGGHQLHPA